MKNYIFFTVFLSLLSISLYCQNKLNSNAYGLHESTTFIKDFVNTFCKGDTLSFCQFDEYFANDENELQMEFAMDMLMSEEKVDVDNVYSNVENYRYSKTPELMEYVIEKLNSEIFDYDCNIHKIEKIDINDLNAYYVFMNNHQEKCYIFVLTFEKTESMHLWDILDKSLNSLLFYNNDKYYIDRLKNKISIE